MLSSDMRGTWLSSINKESLLLDEASPYLWVAPTGHSRRVFVGSDRRWHVALTFKYHVSFVALFSSSIN